MQQFAKRLQHEMQASPKKAAIMGLMAVVALYFWAPLVWGWVKPNSPAPTVKAADPNAEFLPQFTAQLTGGSSPAPAAAAEAPTTPWNQLAERMERDPLMQAAAAAPSARDPFHAPPPAAGPTEAEVVRPVLTSETLGLALSGTIVGAGRRVAVINGKSYPEGSTLELQRDGESVLLQVVTIRPREALVRYAGREFALKVAEK